MPTQPSAVLLAAALLGGCAYHTRESSMVVVTENKSKPGYYGAQFFLRPHYQLEGLNASLRLVSELPSQRGK